MGANEYETARGGPPAWLHEPWEAARRQLLPLCLMVFTRDDAAAGDALAGEIAAALPAAGFGPFELGDGRVAAALTATSPESAYQSAYRVYRALGTGCRVGLAMAAPRGDEYARSLVSHAVRALENTDVRRHPVMGMDVIVS